VLSVHSQDVDMHLHESIRRLHIPSGRCSHVHFSWYIMFAGIFLLIITLQLLGKSMVVQVSYSLVRTGLKDRCKHSRTE
jgi:hypothetical protein